MSQPAKFLDRASNNPQFGVNQRSLSLQALDGGVKALNGRHAVANPIGCWTRPQLADVSTRCALCRRWTQASDALPTPRGPVHFRCIGAFQLLKASPNRPITKEIPCP